MQVSVVLQLWFKDGEYSAELSFRWKKVQINIKMSNPVNLVRSSPSPCHWQPETEAEGCLQNTMNYFAYQMERAKWSVCCLSDFFLFTTSAAGFSGLFAGHLAGKTLGAPFTHCCVLLEEAQHLTSIINLFPKPTYFFSGLSRRQRSILECIRVEGSCPVGGRLMGVWQPMCIERPL